MRAILVSVYPRYTHGKHLKEKVLAIVFISAGIVSECPATALAGMLPQKNVNHNSLFEHVKQSSRTISAISC